MRSRVGSMWKGTGDTGEIRGVKDAAGSGTWLTSARERRLKWKEDKEGGR